MLDYEIEKKIIRIISNKFENTIKMAKKSKKLKLLYENWFTKEIVAFYFESMKACHDRLLTMIYSDRIQKCPASPLLCDLPRRLNGVRCTIAKRTDRSMSINERLMIHTPISSHFEVSQNGCWQY